MRRADSRALNTSFGSPKDRAPLTARLGVVMALPERDVRTMSGPVGQGYLTGPMRRLPASRAACRLLTNRGVH
jgi:hypothetical protein